MSLSNTPGRTAKISKSAPETSPDDIYGPLSPLSALSPGYSDEYFDSFEDSFAESVDLFERSANFTGVKFDGTNYHEWIADLTHDLIARGLYIIAHGSSSDGSERTTFGIELDEARERIYRRLSSNSGVSSSSGQRTPSQSSLSELLWRDAQNSQQADTRFFRQKDGTDAEGFVPGEFVFEDDKDARDASTVAKENTREKIEELVTLLLGSMTAMVREVYMSEFNKTSSQWLTEPTLLLKFVRDDWLKRDGMLSQVRASKEENCEQKTEKYEEKAEVIEAGEVEGHEGDC